MLNLLQTAQWELCHSQLTSLLQTADANANKGAVEPPESPPGTVDATDSLDMNPPSPEVLGVPEVLDDWGVDAGVEIGSNAVYR